MLRSVVGRYASGIRAPDSHTTNNQRGAMFNRKKERTRKSISVGVPADAITDLKGFLLIHAEDPTGPTWSLGRFISQAIHEKILRETEEYVVPATPVEGGSE